VPEPPRRNDLDGRGALSEEALVGFARFFLETCLDQVRFMEGLVQPDRLRDRILIWAEEEVRADSLPPKAGKVLEAVLFRSELPAPRALRPRESQRALRGGAQIDFDPAEPNDRSALRLPSAGFEP